MQRQPFLPPLISLRLGDAVVREPIYLKREMRRRAIEIENVWSDRVLPTKA